MNEKVNPQYWVVGASWGGSDHQDEEFVKNGIWMLGWEEGHQHELAKKMQVGDRIAIKRMRGQGQSDLLIRHVGIIKGVMLDTSNIVCVVDWVAPYLDRVVSESRGCFKSIHGPYGHDEWVQEVFCL